MAEPIQKPDENIVIRTMNGDLEKLSGKTPEPEREKKPDAKKPEPVSVPPIFPISHEAQAPTFRTILPPRPAPKIEMKPAPFGKPPVLVVPPKIIPPKEVAEIPAKPLFKATPVWLKIGGIGLGSFLLVIAGLYGYWKIFIQGRPATIPPTPQVATTTQPVFPTAPTATTTIPIKFFNKLPNKEVTIDIPAKTQDVLIKSLKSEAAEKEALASVKQIKITYQGKPITAGEFLSLMSIFTPRDFTSNYEDEFVLAYFSQKEGARPVLILKAKNRTVAENQIKNWEAGTLPSDILPLFLSDFKLPQRLPAFKSYLFIGQPVRYLNINMPFASLNYALYKDFLIFTSSSAGMFVILQDLTGQTVSQNYLDGLKASIGEFVK